MEQSDTSVSEYEGLLAMRGREIEALKAENSKLQHLLAEALGQAEAERQMAESARGEGMSRGRELDAALKACEGATRALSSANRVNAALSAALRALGEVLGEPIHNQALAAVRQEQRGGSND